MTPFVFDGVTAVTFPTGCEMQSAYSLKSRTRPMIIMNRLKVINFIKAVPTSRYLWVLRETTRCETRKSQGKCPDLI
jgi:hypothetical protein